MDHMILVVVSCKSSGVGCKALHTTPQKAKREFIGFVSPHFWEVRVGPCSHGKLGFSTPSLDELCEKSGKKPGSDLHLDEPIHKYGQVGLLFSFGRLT